MLVAGFVCESGLDGNGSYFLEVFLYSVFGFNFFGLVRVCRGSLGILGI